MLSYFALPLLLLLSNSSGNSAPQVAGKSPEGQTGTQERLIVATGTVAMDLDLDRLRGIRPEREESKRERMRFEVSANSFFTVRVINGVLRDADPGSLELLWGNSAILPEALNASSRQLVVERMPSGEHFELVVRDGKTGFAFFNIEGHFYEYDAAARSLGIQGGRLLVSEYLANKLGRPAEAGAVVGEISITTSMYPIEITAVVNGTVQSSVLPPRGGAPNAPEGALVPGPDIIVGDMPGLAQFGSTTDQVGLGMGGTSCNNGDVPVHFYRLPDPDHSVVSQNLYRMSGGASNNDRFEQIGQAWVKHTFGASQENSCSLGCTAFPNSTELGPGCSDPYSASQNAFQGNTNNGALGSRAWVNPFTGSFPVSPRPENHTGHTHTGTSHRILVNKADLNTTLNVGATYYAEMQYDILHEYTWCQSHPGQCNMYNNASYRRYNVSGTTSFTFAAVGSPVRMTPATGAWTGATSSTIEPAPGVDGRAFVVYKVTGPVTGIWHYEYAIHNQNLDRSIQSFSVPLGGGITLSNVGFHAPPNHPGFPNDGTVGDAGFSNAAWTSNQTAGDVSWSTETFAQNPNANAIRFATMYNFRFDSNRPPTAVNATVGFFKTGAPITVGIQGPAPDGATPTPSATATPPATPTPPTTPSPTPTATATATPTATAVATPTPSPSSDLALTKTDSPDPVQVGNNLTYTITIMNLSPRPTFGVQMTDTLPTGVTFVSVTPSQGSCSGTSTITCNLSDIGGLGSVTVTVVVTPTAAGTISNTATCTAFSPETNPSNNTDTELTTVNPPTTPSPTATATAAPTATATPTPTLSPGITPSPTPTATVVSTATPTPGSTPPPAAQAVNLSTRMRVQTGDNVGIGGFIITGSAPKHVLIRAIGPSLAQFGVPNVLADPTLELHGPGGVVMDTNDNWRDDPAQEAAILATGIAPTSNLESAIDATLNPGAYTAVVRGKNNTSGVALIEVYDLSQAVLAKLANISTRAFASTGDNIVIAGFTLGGNSGDDRIAVRGLGPSLAALGVSNVLADPTLELRDGNGALIASNNNWQDDPAQMAELMSAGLAPGNPLESAISATLPPGPYTALLAGLNNGSGVGVVEVYDRGTP